MGAIHPEVHKVQLTGAALELDRPQLVEPDAPAWAARDLTGCTRPGAG